VIVAYNSCEGCHLRYELYWQCLSEHQAVTLLLIKTSMLHSVYNPVISVVSDVASIYVPLVPLCVLAHRLGERKDTWDLLPLPEIVREPAQPVLTLQKKAR